ncbi:hypothetical protein ACFOD1_09700 [Pseudidiomarina halophila]|uniref:Uncharacterized protein n=1 Tax=Pseudidiomarina halophila TaxID=1449799 RepID=A0A432Y128_9GAMM|nr:hypothetical protein [Pseudidiomarina halophila]RUO54641.1 hypothetical protein CWI69_04310 [Pseudidiomarina halophila]
MKLEAILQDPSKAYENPEDVLNDSNLTHDQKKQVLDQWEYDALELQVATEENMPGPEQDYLADILEAKKKLNGDDE